MITNIASVTIAVEDQNEALDFYVDILGFEQRADMPMESGKRCITVAPPDSQVLLVLQPLDWFEGEEREERRTLIGKAPTIVLDVDDCKHTYIQLSSRGVEFTKVPIDTSYVIEAICKDLYGNTLVLLEKSV
jgi:catechol 2,3-dioxygenase-like lactoylglutathione lyase family enzyme